MTDEELARPMSEPTREQVLARLNNLLLLRQAQPINEWELELCRALLKAWDERDRARSAYKHLAEDREKAWREKP